MTHTATYSPEDNKLRMSPAHRLDKADYERFKAAGFSWAPKQELFVAGMWTPDREDLLIEFCGEIDDEDKSLVERAEERAERFEGYSDSRATDAARARDHVASIADGIPFGQPILVGHHSERHARRDAEKIRSGMDRAVKMWETSKYWESRAAGAIAHAKYKELPAVRHRRIKGIEADKRKAEKMRDEMAARFEAWCKCAAIEDEEKRARVALIIANTCGSFSMPRKEGDRDGFTCDVYGALTGSYPTIYAPRTLAEVLEQTTGPRYPRSIAHYERWIQHYQNRLTYERAMLAEGGGLVGQNHDIQLGGRVLVGGSWLPVTKINRDCEGRISSITAAKLWYKLESIKGYQEPNPEDVANVKAANKLPPLCNYNGESFAQIDQARWDKIHKDYKGTREYGEGAEGRFIESRGNSTEAGRHRVRHALGCLIGVAGSHSYLPVFITDAKVTAPPMKGTVVTVKLDAIPDKTDAEVMQEQADRLRAANDRRDAEKAESAEFDAMKQSLLGGVQVVSAPQLFPTPAGLAARVVELADIQSGQCVLEPSAGTGNLVRAVLDRVDTEVLAYEINSGLCSQLGRTFPSHKLQVRCKDFLEVTDFQGQYPRVIMNPPFADSQDIAHVRHAYGFLKPGGRLVAIMGEGAFFRQDRKATEFRGWLEEVGGYAEVLPSGSFEASGTGVNTRLVVIDAPAVGGGA